MVNTLIKFVRDIFRDKSVGESLEAYIVSHNPRDSVDVDRLEREFWEKRRQSDFFNGYI